MGWHLFISICLALAGGCIAAAFGVGSGTAAIIGVLIFLVYWGVCTLWVHVDDLF